MSNLKENKQISEGMPGTFCSLLLSKGLIAKPMKSSFDNAEVILVYPKDIIQAATTLKTHKEVQFDLLFSVSGVDKSDCFEVVYHFLSTKLNKRIVLKCQLDKNNPEIDSIASVYKTADWHERETYDLFGIIFNNHPDLKRILLPNDWVGHPLRKDYKMNDERLTWNER